MKKIAIVLIVLSMLLMCMTACSGSGDPEPTPTLTPTQTPPPDDTNPPITPTIYDLLDSLVDKDYSTIEIDIVTTTGFAELYSNYVLTQSNVVYSIEKLNLLPSDGNITDLPSNYKTTVTGYALIENGQIVELSGDKDVTLPSYDELKGDFNFDETNFKNAVVGTNSFEADVISASKFYGADVDLSNLKVRVEYTETSFTQITISYSTTNATVQTIYAFGN
ncbi:MAG: hypothetical protein J6Q82_03755 [Clostridia bacterium]|nr:hypothetical protein [Clostridia bacterium]